jgi:hypothetical protein
LDVFFGDSIAAWYTLLQAIESAQTNMKKISEETRIVVAFLVGIGILAGVAIGVFLFMRSYKATTTISVPGVQTQSEDAAAGGGN